MLSTHLNIEKHRHIGDIHIARRPLAAPPSRKGPRINSDITSSRVLLITETGEKRGEVSIEDALMAARTAGLDLVEVAPNPEMPVVKILDYGKVRFENQKKKAAARKKQKTQEIKEIKMRPNIDTHDYETKGKAIRKFLERGDKVKVTIRFRGREMAHMNRGMDLLQRVKVDFDDIIKVEFEPKTEGRMMTMVIAPK